jgi:uncharacterized protein (TIGR03086 family)
VIDIEPAATRLADLLQGVSDDQLARPTPCPGQSVGDLVDHLSVFAVSFVGSARKEAGGRDGPPPVPTTANLGAGWRDRVSAELADLAAAWREPSAWHGVTYAGSIQMPAELVGLVAVDELVVHGWDIAVATGQAFDPPIEEIEASQSFVTSFDVPRDGTLFGPVVEVAAEAPPLERLLGLTGRDPRWSSPT